MPDGFLPAAVEFLRAIDLLFACSTHARLCRFLKHRQNSVCVGQLGMCEREVRVGVNRLFVKSDCILPSAQDRRIRWSKCVGTLQIKLVSDGI